MKSQGKLNFFASLAHVAFNLRSIMKFIGVSEGNTKDIINIHDAKNVDVLNMLPTCM